MDCLHAQTSYAVTPNDILVRSQILGDRDARAAYDYHRQYRGYVQYVAPAVSAECVKFDRKLQAEVVGKVSLL